MRFLSAFLLATGISVSATPLNQDTISQGHVTIELVTLNGSGCPPGTAAVAVSPDNSAFTVTYSSYVVQNGQGTSVVDGRKNCQAVVRVEAPAGFTYAVSQATYRGFAQLQVEFVVSFYQ